MRPITRGCRFALLVGLVAVVAACQVEGEVTVTVDEDGSGTVEVALGLDDEAMARLPDPNGSGGSSEARLVELVRTADLEAVGWEVSGPDELEGMTWLRLTRSFGNPGEATQILAELAPSGFSDLEVSRSSSFGRDRYELSGTVDLSGGLETFADAALGDLLEGEPLGESSEAMAERFGQPVEDMFGLVVRADLPGDAEQQWEPELGGGPVDIQASSTVYNVPALSLAVVAAASLVGLVLLFVVRTLRTSRHRSS